VKNTTWSDGDLALFPDTVTERGQKHLVELTALVPGTRAVLLPCLSRGDVMRFAPGDSADPRYGELFWAAETLALDLPVTATVATTVVTRTARHRSRCIAASCRCCPSSADLATSQAPRRRSA
jgi:sugar fermentation stimulation protein A